uniref:Uncharacterized protein n=1 Tax=Quercus lobata TaxID=97700 RepID=A0A7N2N803_QUELO
MAYKRMVAGNMDPKRKRSGGLRTKQAGRGSCRGRVEGEGIRNRPPTTMGRVGLGARENQLVWSSLMSNGGGRKEIRSLLI